jgi:hypothetical protein
MEEDEDEDTRKKKVAEQLCVEKERKEREDKSRVKRLRQQALTAKRDRASHTNKDQKKRGMDMKRARGPEGRWQRQR